MAKTPRVAATDRPAANMQKRGREDSRRGNAPAARSAEGRSSKPQSEAEAVKRGRGRPKENRGTVIITLRLPPAVVEAADEIIEQSGHVYRDRSEFFRQAIALVVSLSQGSGGPILSKGWEHDVIASRRGSEKK